MAATLCECPLCQATFQATSEMAGLAVQCPSCGRAVQLPEQLGAGHSHVVRASRIDVCNCPGCGQGFGYTTQMLGTTVACPHCNLSFKLSIDGRPMRESGREANKRFPADPARPTVETPSPRPPQRGDSGSSIPAKPDEPNPKAKRTRFRDAPGVGALPDEPLQMTGPAAPELADIVIQTDKPTRGALPESPPMIRVELGAGKGDEQAGRATPAKEIPVDPSRAAGPKAKETRRSDSPKMVPQPSPRNLETEASRRRSGDMLEKRRELEIPGVAKSGPAEPSVGKTDQQDLLPPTLNESLAGSNRAAAEMLPPKFYSSDPTIIRQKRTRGDQAFVLLPDEKGGFQRVNNTVIRIQHEGETIILAAPDPSKVRRKRLVVNLLTLIVCLAVLYLVFRALLD